VTKVLVHDGVGIGQGKPAEAIYNGRDANILRRIVQIYLTKPLLAMWQETKGNGTGTQDAYRDASKNVD
jgi:hypothetical protein